MQPATEWGYSEIFQNKMVHLLETIVWQNSTPSEPGKKARHKAMQPKLLMPDFMQQNDNGIKKDVVSYDIDELKELLNKPRV